MIRKWKKKIEFVYCEPSNDAERKLYEELKRIKEYYRMLDMYRPEEDDEEM